MAQLGPVAEITEALKQLLAAVSPAESETTSGCTDNLIMIQQPNWHRHILRGFRVLQQHKGLTEQGRKVPRCGTRSWSLHCSPTPRIGVQSGLLMM